MNSAKPVHKIGVGGNHYVYCDYRDLLYDVVDKIGKSRRGIYFNSKYQTWAIRCKAKIHKLALVKHFAG